MTSLPLAEHFISKLPKYLEEKHVGGLKGILHVQKRLGTALRSYKNIQSGAVLSDGKGTGGKDV